MKTKMILALLVLTLPAATSDDNYVEAVGKQMKAVFEAKSTDELMSAANALDRIAQSEQNKWEPHYYAAFSYIMMANREQEASKKDTYLDAALTRVQSAAAVSKDNSEISALEGFVHMIRVSVDPANRGQKYSGMSMKAFGKALKQDSNNPRAMALMAQMQFGTAKFFGASTDESCAMGRKAQAQFAAPAGTDLLAPRWGKEMNEGFLKGCTN